MSVEPNQVPVEPNPTDAGGKKSEGDPNAPEGFVKYDSHKKLLDEKKSLQAKYDALMKEKSDAESAKAKAIEDELKAKDDWKKVVGIKEQEIESLKAQVDQLKSKDAENEQRRTNGLKMKTFLEALPGKLEQPYWDLVDLERIVVNPETGLPEPTSVANLAKEFEAKYARVIDRSNGAQLPNDAPRGAGTKLTYDEWLKLPADKKKERLSEVMNAS